jgi:hypothetical protein
VIAGPPPRAHASKIFGSHAIRAGLTLVAGHAAPNPAIQRLGMTGRPIYRR